MFKIVCRHKHMEKAKFQLWTCLDFFLTKNWDFIPLCNICAMCIVHCTRTFVEPTQFGVAMYTLRTLAFFSLLILCCHGGGKDKKARKDIKELKKYHPEKYAYDK